jgi:hypothetical protein
MMLGYVALHQHDWQEAHTRLAESLNLWRELRYEWEIAACLLGVATMAAEQGQAARATELSGATEVLLKTHHPKGFETHSGEVIVQTEYDHLVTAVRVALGEEAFAAAWAKGQAMTLEQALALALEGQQNNDIAR